MYPNWKSFKTYGPVAIPAIVIIPAPILGILGMLGHIEPVVALAAIMLLQCLCFSLSALRPFEDQDRHDRASHMMATAGTAVASVSLGLLGALHLDWLQPVAAVITIICCGCGLVVLKRTLRNMKAAVPGQSGT